MGISNLTADVPTEQNEATQERNEWEAQSLLTCLTWPLKEITGKECAECGESFLTGYDKVAYCSNICTENALKKHFGIWWHPKESFFEQWGAMEPPLLIGPRQIQAMRDLLSLLDQENPDQMYSPEPDYEDDPEPVYSVSPDPPFPANGPETQQEIEGIDSDFLSLLESFRDE